MATQLQLKAVTLAEILPAAVVRAIDSQLAKTNVGPLVLDSRQVTTGITFVAVPGLQVDGRQFIAAAITAGATLVLAEAEHDAVVVTQQANVTVIAIPQLRKELSAIAARYYGEPAQSLFTVGITGTNGKTSCSYWLASLLSRCGIETAIVGTLGYGRLNQLLTTGMTTPDAVRTQAILAECVAAGAKGVAMEVSSHSLDQCRVSGVAFDVAVFTNLSRDHLDYHGTEQAYRDAKIKLMAMAGLQRAVINLDDAQAQAFISVAIKNTSVWTYSNNDATADFYCTDISYGVHGISAKLHCPLGQYVLQAPIIGSFNLSNLLAVIAAASVHFTDIEQLLELVKSLPGVPGRMQQVAHASDINVLVDYAHTPDALRSVLMAVRQHCLGDVWCVFGCGGDRDQGKRPQMGSIAEQYADRIVITSDNPRSESAADIIEQIAAGIDDLYGVEIIADRAEAIAFAIANAAAEDCVLLAGKGHEDYQQIGVAKLPFDDAVHARLALKKRGENGL